MDNLSIFVFLHEEAKVELVGIRVWEDSFDGVGVGVQDSVEGQAGSLNWVFVHVYLIK